MKKNRQIGLNGRIFVSNCLRRSTLFVFIVMFGGIATAVADIFKLTGSSGAVMSSFTTTLLLWDFIASLMLVVVMFYAYFLECGDSVPVIKDKPLICFGFTRLGYYILLAYYICYRALYCLTNKETVPRSLCFFYITLFLYVCLCILANCFLFNIITRNTIRRNYIRSFHTISTFGLISQVLLITGYIIARVLMKSDIGDEYFTTSLTDLFRLCICPIFTVGVWMIFSASVSCVNEVYNEVDTALRDRRYQITYVSPESDGNKKKSGELKSAGGVKFLPSPTEKKPSQLTAPETPPALKAASTGKTSEKSAAQSASDAAQSDAEKTAAASSQQKNKNESESDSQTKKSPKSSAKQDAPKVLAEAPVVVSDTGAVYSAAPTEFGSETRQLQEAENAAAAAPKPQTEPGFIPESQIWAQGPMVQDYNPYPDVRRQSVHPQRKSNSSGSQKQSSPYLRGSAQYKTVHPTKQSGGGKKSGGGSGNGRSSHK